jgi:hypothetical protein
MQGAGPDQLKALVITFFISFLLCETRPKRIDEFSPPALDLKIPFKYVDPKSGYYGTLPSLSRRKSEKNEKNRTQIPR